MANDQQRAALEQLDGLLALADAGTLDAPACGQLLELSALVPGRLRRVVDTLSRQRHAAAVDVLLGLPADTRGIIEALFSALRHGVTRTRPDGAAFPAMMALEFRTSTSRRFPALRERASAAFGRDLERIRVGGKLHYRLALIDDPTREPSLSARVAPLELDIERLHQDLARLRGVRLWLNGWCFDDHSNIRAPARAPLLRGWLEWARERQR
ncbi:hypothetical protein ENSA5_28990 [Enhygromyxa salina]|uniref:Uncharacterized protein n=1 Tax=Enhygromyxa salina TaxID=215803 RepID=A0A2S9Y1Q6_9BACT|nr:hypothetical protein [Enhygromyxa salina]PRP99057.1 hypothetical protein ENSA5_28990 [Enhygromyxa salina]